ncbi:MAG: EamA family transporter [Clostridia bacterium]|nr:EamA family transporter [Clostridia bacterium]
MKKNHAALFMVLAGISWSFAGVLGKFSQWGGLSLAGYRSLIAIFVLGLVRGSFRPVNTRWNWIGALGVALTSMLFMTANKLTSAANAIVLQYAMTAIVILFQVIVMRIRPRRIDVAAAVLVMAGVVLCFCQNLGQGRLAGDLLGFASAFTWAAVFLSAQMPGVDPMDYSYQGNLICALLSVNLLLDGNVRSSGMSGLLVASAMGILNVMGYLFFSLSMRGSIDATAAAIIANIEPVLNPLWVLLFLGEDPGALTILGALVVLATVTIYSLAAGRQSKPESPDRT